MFPNNLIFRFFIEGKDNYFQDAFFFMSRESMNNFNIIIYLKGFHKF